MNTLLLGVNIDHIATIRNVRGTTYPDPLHAAFIAEQAGADSITVHLREDRRHITDRDLKVLCKILNIHVNMEMAVTKEMLNIACNIKPYSCCLVPENRQEMTTESGLDVINQFNKIKEVCSHLISNGIKVSLFINSDFEQIEAASNTGATHIEIHTGYYSDAENDVIQTQELDLITKAATYATSLGLKVNAGHGINYHNVRAIAMIPEIYELNIGHAIISRAVINGLQEAVSKMKSILTEARQQ